MKRTFLMAAIAAATTVGPAAEAGELPSFELMGFPITRHQVAVMGARGVQEQSATPTLTFGGMPASPHQIVVLTPRPSMIAKGSIVRSTDGLAAE